MPKFMVNLSRVTKKGTKLKQVGPVKGGGNGWWSKKWDPK